MPLRKAEACSVPGRGERPTTGQPGLSRVVQLDCRNACWVRFRSSSKRPSVASRALIQPLLTTIGCIWRPKAHEYLR